MEEANKIVEQSSENGWTDLKTGRFIIGNPGGGRPKGSISIKDKIRKQLEDNPEELKAFVQHFIDKNRELAWQMLEGRPSQDMKLSGELNIGKILDEHDN